MKTLTINRNVFGPEDFRTATTMSNFAGLYREMGDYAKAEPLFKRALTIRRRVLGREHRHTAETMNNLALLYREKRDYAKAERLFKEAHDVARKVLGPQHPGTAATLTNLATLYKEKGDYAKAEPLFKKALKIREKNLGLDHPGTATSLNTLGLLYSDKGDYAKAEPLLQKALKIREKVLGPQHPDTATTLNNLANVYLDTGNYGKAERLLKRALKIQEEAYGPEHPDTATVLNGLAALYFREGDYAKAEPLFRKALKIWEEVRGEQHPDTAIALNNLAKLHMEKGDYAHAQPLLEVALKIGVKTLGPGHPNIAPSLINLALLYHKKGDYRRAELLLKRALTICETTLGPDHHHKATIISSLAALYFARGDYSAAKPLFQRALKIHEKILGSEHCDTAGTLSDLALLYFEEGNYAEAEQLFTRSVEIFETSLGPDHPNTATSLNNLALVCHEKGDYAKAAPFYKRALEIHANALGPDHPIVVTDLINLAWLYLTVGNATDALRLSLRAAEVEAAVRENVFATSSQQQRMLFIDKQFNAPRTIMLTLASRDSELNDEALRSAALWTIRSKRRVLDSILEDRIRLRDNPEAQEVLEWLRTVKKTLSALMLKPTGGTQKKAIARRKKRIQELKVKRETLEKRLARMAGRYREGRRASNVTLPEVRAHIPEGAALIEFVRFAPIATAEQREEKELERTQLPPVYGALVVGHTEGDLSLVDLGSAEKIDTLLSGYQQAMEEGKPVFDLAKKLHGKLWRPIEKRLQGRKQVILSPAGSLNFLSFATLVGPDDRYLAEKYRIGYVGSGRDLVRRVEEKTEGASLFGNPAFGQEKDVNTDFLTRKGTHRSTLRGQDRSLLSQMQFAPLPGTKKEVEAIARLARKRDRKVETLLEKKASEARLKSLRKPQVLHLATHGFYLPDVKVPEKRTPQPMQMVQTTGTRGGGGMAALSASGPVMVENPMHRSGLALAGASKLGEDRDQRGEDGIVTAEEVGTLDLWGTELVVLSACETGLGEVAGGEGVMGLRRAFLQAGAKNLVLSLWPVDDEATARLMEKFYRRYLESGDAVGAMTRTQRYLLSQARQNGEKIHPSKWGAFVVSFQGSPNKGGKSE